MPAPAPSRLDDIEIPDRPAVTSEAARAQTQRRRILLYGGVAALALVVLAMIAMLVSGKHDQVARTLADAPLIRAEDQPIKVPPESPGGRDASNKDILVYGRLHGTPSGKPPVEQLLPEPELPQVPPPPPSRPNSSSEPTLTPARPAVVEPLPSAAASATPGSKLPTAEAAAKPAPTTVAQAKIPPTAATSSTPRAAQPAKPAKAVGYQIQLVSSRSEEEAKAAWARLKSKNTDLLGPLSPIVARAELGDRGTFYRLRAGPIATEAKARSLCRSLAGRGVSCLIIHSSG